MQPFKHGFRSFDRSITLLSCAALGSLIFTLTAAFLLNNSTRRLVSAKDWVEHTQEVLTALQTASQISDRIDYNVHLYSIHKDPIILSTAQTNGIRLKSTVYQIGLLVTDNIHQSTNVEHLAACSQSIGENLRSPSGEDAVTDALLQCREAIGVMGEQERSLLKQRTEHSQKSSVVSTFTETAFIFLSTVTLIVLFGFLFRDAVLRRKASQTSRQVQLDLEASVEALGERVIEAKLLTACRDEIQLCVTIQQLYSAAAEGMQRLVLGSSGYVGIIRNSNDYVEVVSEWGANQRSTVTNMFAPESCCGLRLGQLRLRAEGGSLIHCSHFREAAPARYLCMPMVAQGETLGVIYLECEDNAVYQAVERRMDGLRQLTQLTSMAIASMNLRNKLENQSFRDPLTGLFNRRFLEVNFDQELGRAARENNSLAVFMLDVDHFKNFNDTHGHSAGDTMLKAVADIFGYNIRLEDTVCRYGGEEFAIVLPNIGVEAAIDRAERILRAVRNLNVMLPNGAEAQVSVSIGMSFFPLDGDSREILLSRADTALYQAKRQGRDQVCVWRAEIPALLS